MSRWPLLLGASAASLGLTALVAASALDGPTAARAAGAAVALRPALAPSPPSRRATHLRGAPAPAAKRPGRDHPRAADRSAADAGRSVTVREPVHRVRLRTRPARRSVARRSPSRRPAPRARAAPTAVRQAAGPAAPPAAAPPQGRIAFRLPPGRHVQVDGQVVGASPLPPLPVAVGPHVVVVTDPVGYRQRRRSVVVVAGRTALIDVGH